MKHDPPPNELPGPTRRPLLPALQVEAFVEYPQTRLAVRRAQRNGAFTRMQWRFREGGLAGAISAYKEERSPDLLIIESDEEGRRVVALLEELARECREDTKVLFIGGGAEHEVELFRKVLKLGVSDFLPAPVDAAKIIGAITDTYDDVSDIKLGRITAFIGAGGGTGSSSIAQNAAMAMARLMGTDVLLADLDPQFGTVALNFNAEDAYTLSDVLRRRSPIDELLIERILKPTEERLKLLLVDPTIDSLPNLPVQAINAILDLAQSTPRHVILDMTHVWGLRTKKTLCRADEIVVTTMPTLAGLRNVRNIVEVLRRIRPTDHDPLVVLNKTGLPRRVEVSTAEFREALGLEAVFEIPYDSKLFSIAQTEGTGIIHVNETARVSKHLIDLARHINRDLDNGDPRPSSERLFSRLRKWW